MTMTEHAVTMCVAVVQHLFFAACMNVSAENVSDVALPQKQEAYALLAEWFPVAAELQWLLRQLSRALCPAFGDRAKMVLVHADTLDQLEGRGQPWKNNVPAQHSTRHSRPWLMYRGVGRCPHRRPELSLPEAQGAVCATSLHRGI